MPKEVFGFRAKDNYTVACIFVILGPLFAIMGPVYFRAGEGSKSEEILSMIGGGLGFAYGVYLLAYIRNWRIEIEDGRVSWFNWLGQRKVCGSLQSVESPSATDPSDKLVFTTDGGQIKVPKIIRGYARLKSILETKSVPEQAN